MESIACTPAADYRTDAIRADGWTPQRQIIFLQSLANSGMVSAACQDAGMSATAAYALRRRPEGIAFALGWKAAILLARDRLEDSLLEAAIAGVETVITKEEGVTRRRALNSGLAMGVLNRLDRQALALDNAEAGIARAIGSAFAAFMDLIAASGGLSDVAAFLERHPDPLAAAAARRHVAVADSVAASSAAQGVAAARVAEAAQVTQARKLVERSAIFLSDGGMTDVAIGSTRAQRRAQRAKKRAMSSR